MWIRPCFYRNRKLFSVNNFIVQFKNRNFVKCHETSEYPLFQNDASCHGSPRSWMMKSIVCHNMSGCQPGQKFTLVRCGFWLLRTEGSTDKITNSYNLFKKNNTIKSSANLGFSFSGQTKKQILNLKNLHVKIKLRIKTNLKKYNRIGLQTYLNYISICH